jgi:hypothetical protein
VLVGDLTEKLLKPRTQALQVLDALRQDAGVHEDLSDVVQALILRKLIEEVMANWAAFSG